MEENIEMIVDTVSEAFDSIPVLKCNTKGLFDYIRDCNEFFLKRQYEPERLCYAVAFLNEAQKRNMALEDMQERRLKEDAKKLAEEYPDYNTIIQNYY